MSCLRLLYIVNDICSLIQQKRPSHVTLSHLLCSHPSMVNETTFWSSVYSIVAICVTLLAICSFTVCNTTSLTLLTLQLPPAWLKTIIIYVPLNLLVACIAYASSFLYIFLFQLTEKFINLCTEPLWVSVLRDSGSTERAWSARPSMTLSTCGHAVEYFIVQFSHFFCHSP